MSGLSNISQPPSATMRTMETTRTMAPRIAPNLAVAVDVVDGRLDRLVDVHGLRVVLDLDVRYDALARAVQIGAGLRILHLRERDEEQAAIRQVVRLPAA